MLFLDELLECFFPHGVVGKSGSPEKHHFRVCEEEYEGQAVGQGHFEPVE